MMTQLELMDMVATEVFGASSQDPLVRVETPDWTYCEEYCRGPKTSYRLTLWPGLPDEWTDPETHLMCARCAEATIARGNRLTAIQPNAPASATGSQEAKQ